MLDFTEEFLSGSIGFNLLAYRTVFLFLFGRSHHKGQKKKKKKTLAHGYYFPDCVYPSNAIS